MTAAGIPLSMAATGKPLRVVRIDGGRGLARRLADLGLTPGAHLQRVDASEAWSASAMLHGRGFGGFFGGWRHRGSGAPAPADRGGRRFGLFGRWPRRGRRGRMSEEPPGSESAPPGSRLPGARPDGPTSAERPRPASRSIGWWRGGRLRGRSSEGSREGWHAGFGRRPQERSGSAVVVEFRGSKYVLGYGVSEKIVVSEEQEETGPRRER